MVNKHIPLRKCVGCNEMKSKRDLIRVVKSKDNEIEIDFSGKKPGRGSYLCKNLDCFKAAKKNKRFEKAFSCKISEEIYNKLEGELTQDEK